MLNLFDKKEKELRDDIFKKVIEFYNYKKEKEKFILGQSPIPYAGRVLMKRNW